MTQRVNRIADPGSAEDPSVPAGFSEDLTALTIAAARTAPRLCRGCAGYHGSWPALRLAGAMTGLDADRPVLIDAAKRMLSAGGRQRMLIAGSADTGLLATMAAAAAASPAEVRFTIIDLCETPLALARAYGDRTGLEVETRAVDLHHYQPPVPQDIVFAHSVLRFVKRDAHRECLDRMRGWLRPGGGMLYGTRLRDTDHAGASRDRKLIAMRVIGDNQDIPPEIRSRIRDWLMERLDSGETIRQVRTRREILELFHESGFTDLDDRIFPGGDRFSQPAESLPERIVVSARRPAESGG